MHVTKSPNTTGRAKGIGLLVVQAVVAAAIYCWIVLQSFSVAGCGYSCNYPLLSAAYNTYIWVAVGSFVVSLVGVVILSSRGNESWWVPGGGLGLTVLAGTFTLVAIQIATSP